MLTWAGGEGVVSWAEPFATKCSVKLRCREGLLLHDRWGWVAETENSGLVPSSWELQAGVCAHAGASFRAARAATRSRREGFQGARRDRPSWWRPCTETAACTLAGAPSGRQASVVVRLNGTYQSTEKTLEP